jgi:hypothetical protein
MALVLPSRYLSARSLPITSSLRRSDVHSRSLVRQRDISGASCLGSRWRSDQDDSASRSASEEGVQDHPERPRRTMEKMLLVRK